MPVPRESFDDEPDELAPADQQPEVEDDDVPQQRRRGPVRPGQVKDLRAERPAPTLGPAGSAASEVPGEGAAGDGDRPAGPLSSTRRKSGSAAKDAGTATGARQRSDARSEVPKVRLGCDAPAQVVAAVSDEVTRRQRQGRGDRTDLAMEMLAALPTRIEDIDQLLEMVDACERWIAAPRSRRLEYRVPPLVRQHVENLVSWAYSAGGVELDKTDVVLAMTTNIVDPDSPPLDDGQADEVEQLLSQYR